MNEADPCRTYILPRLQSPSWEDEFITEQLVWTPGRIVAFLNGLRTKVNAASCPALFRAVTVPEV